MYVYSSNEGPELVLFSILIIFKFGKLRTKFKLSFLCVNGTPSYNLAYTISLDLLDTISQTGLGAFLTGGRLNLCAEASETPSLAAD